MKTSLSRRAFLKAAGLGAAGGILAACQPKTIIVKETVEVEVEKEKIVTQVVEVEKEVTKIVAGTPVIEKVVETKIVEKVVTAVPEAPVELVFAEWFHGQDVPPDSDNWIQQQIEGAFNVKLDIWLFERWTMGEQFAARIAGGEVPDRWHAMNISLPDLVEQELISEIPIELFAEMCPRVFAASQKYMDGDMVCWLQSNYQGVNYGVPGMTTTQAHPWCDGWRQDSLDKAGVTRLPETLEEHEAALYALVEKGAYDYAFTPRLGDWVQGSFISIHGAFGTYPFFWIPTEDGSGVEWGGVSDRARDAVELIQRWWADGIINPESLTTKWKDLVNDWCQGRSGFVDCGTWYRLIPGAELYDCIYDQGGVVSMAWAPKGPNGNYGYPGWGHAGGNGFFGRSLASDDTKMRKVLELEDALRGDPYWATLINYGKQGEHYYRDPELGLQRRKVEELDGPVEKVGWQFLGYQYGQPIPDIWYGWQGSLLPQQVEKAFAGNTQWIPELGSFMDPEMCKDFTETGPTEDGWYVDFYSGAKPMSEWDNFVNAYMEAGGECNQKNADEAGKNRQSILDSIRTKVQEIAG